MKKLFLTLVLGVAAFGAYAQLADNDARYNQYGTRVNRMSLQPEARDGILVFESQNQTFRFWFDIRVQIDGAFFFGEKEFMDPIGNGISIRRARFAVKSQINENWYGEIDMDLSDGEFELKDALIRYSTCNWEFSLGNFKEDFSMEQTTSSRYLPMMERPMAVQAFAPSRHLGLDAKFRKNWFYMSAGAFFQTIDNLETSTNVKDNNKDFGRSQGVSFTGKVVFNPWYKDAWRGLHIGGGASYRTPKTDVAKGDYPSIRYDVRNSTAINRKKYTDTDNIKDVDKMFLWNGEFAAHYRGLRLQGEYIGNNVIMLNKAADNRTKVFGGWYAMAGVVLFGGEQRYNMGDAKFTQPTRGRWWGDIELIARYDYIDLNSKDIYGGAGQNFTFGLNYYFNENVKFVLNYQYSWNDRYANGRGDYKVGYTAEGNPTSDYKLVDAAKGKAGIRYNMIGMRMEIDF
ncbi:OprO/OprP family phosphate-selective porin [Alistipes sp. OttesenSCG-928-B03]|nr:OprO/OprP family phosphate-selective porin [Alistipes sp. OttesenSCG-928-B03]